MQAKIILNNYKCMWKVVKKRNNTGYKLSTHTVNSLNQQETW